MLYRPLSEEVKDDEIETLYNEKEGDELKIDIVKSQVMEFLEGVTEARYHAEQLKKELDIDLDEIAATRLDPQGLQDNEQCDLEGADAHEDYQHLDPDGLKGHNCPEVGNWIKMFLNKRQENWTNGRGK